MVDGSVQQTLLDTFDCRAIFFWTNVATSGSARLKILKELRNTLTKIKNIMMTKLPPTNWVIRFWGLETSSANFSYRWTEATIPTYYRLRTESRFRNASEFTLDLAHSIWRLLELASNPTKNIRGQHFPKGVSQTVEEFWSDDSWQFTKLSNGFHKVAQQPGPTWFLSNIALAYCNLQERPDPDSLGLTSQITDVSTICEDRWIDGEAPRDIAPTYSWWCQLGQGLKCPSSKGSPIGTGRAASREGSTRQQQRSISTFGMPQPSFSFMTGQTRRYGDGLPMGLIPPSPPTPWCTLEPFISAATPWSKRPGRLWRSRSSFG
jgi:hypothetical protein